MAFEKATVNIYIYLCNTVPEAEFVIHTVPLEFNVPYLGSSRELIGKWWVARPASVKIRIPYLKRGFPLCKLNFASLLLVRIEVHVLNDIDLRFTISNRCEQWRTNFCTIQTN